MNDEPHADRVYRGLWSVLARYFRVPKHAPEIPGAGEHANAGSEPFKPSPGFLAYLKLWFWIAALLIDVILVIAWLAIFIAEWWLGVLLTPIMIALIVLPDIIAYVALHLRYDTTWYVLTDRALRIRRGIWVIQEKTITYENVQNVKVTQGPVQRRFGIANVIVETAGAGAAVGKHQQAAGNHGVIEGVRNAREIRDRVLAKLRQSQSAGLGDEDDSPHPTAAPALSEAHLMLLRQIRDELAAVAG